MTPHGALADRLGRAPASINVVLFSRPRCAFCKVVRVHHLVPLMTTRPAGIVVAEVEIESRRTLSDASGQPVSHAAFAARHGVRFAPTVMFLDRHDRPLAPSIVGLSEDFFGAYLEARIAESRRAVDGGRGP